MEPPSALPRGGRVPWQELLLAVSLLTFWNPPTTAQVTVESVPPNAAEGKDVLLRVHNLPANLIGYGWFKGTTIDPHREIVSYAPDSQEINPGYAHSGRETLYLNGSLLFQNINLKDTGYYTLQIIKRNVQVERVTGQLRVYQPVSRPSINISNTTATEHKDSVVLTCSTNNTGVSIWWFFNNQSLKLLERMKLSPDNSTLTVDPVRREDAGDYQCEVSNRASSNRSDPIRLAVSYGRSPTGLPVGTSVGIAIGVLVGVALVAALGYLLLRVKAGRASGQRNHREMGRPAFTPGHGPVSSSTSPSALPSPRTAVPIYQELQHPDRNIYCQINYKGQVSS
uniref:Carcinoembryonic antigen-related cell adhesion molecule 6-like n=1 Tax=Lynx canadensis TaxID=61383 RepID=A0A667ID61_LYNCA